MTYRERLEELYTAAYNADDISLALEISDRMKALPVVPVVDIRVVEFVEALDALIHCSENGHDAAPHRFDYCLKQFEVKLIDG